MEQYESPYDFDAYDSGDSYDNYGERTRPWRTRRRVWRSPVPPPPIVASAARATVTPAEVTHVARAAAAENEVTNERISEALKNIKKEATGTKRGLKNAQMMGLLPLLLNRGPNVVGKSKTITVDQVQHDVVTDVEVKGQDDKDKTLLLVLVMMMTMMSGDREDDNSSMMMMLVLVLMLGTKDGDSQPKSVVQKTS